MYYVHRSCTITTIKVSLQQLIMFCNFFSSFFCIYPSLFYLNLEKIYLINIKCSFWSCIRYSLLYQCSNHMVHFIKTFKLLLKFNNFPLWKFLTPLLSHFFTFIDTILRKVFIQMGYKICILLIFLMKKKLFQFFHDH